jgi:ComF family protein
MPFDTGGTIISAAAAANPPNYDHARAVGHFSGIMRDLILSFKYADSHHARKLFGRWLSSAGVELINDCDIIAPVPMHPFRLLNRRFNQSAILAKEVAKTNNRRYEPMILNRVRQTQSQVGLSSDQRRRNLAGAFALTARQKTRVKNCNILLIDDVITTGTTLNACARALRRAGAARVDALALAIVTHDSQITL